MTTIPTRPELDEADLRRVLAGYTEIPMDDGDAVLLLDGVCMEIPGLADQWDEPGRRNLAGILVRTCSSVVLAIARAGSRLRSSDVELWCQLDEELRGTSVQLMPLRALPAA